ncbi:MAG TPA: tetratricopeptide repeat protein [Thermoanaerobaculia bacterium]|nr:tetratricopeptide repeat protein [Thermoanaerobaculia bacterium]
MPFRGPPVRHCRPAGPSQPRVSTLGYPNVARRGCTDIERRSALAAKTFDIFLSHNSKDKPAVRQIAEALRDRGLEVWLDEWELVPGRPWIPELERQIQTARTVAVFVGENGLGPWERPEMEVALMEGVRRGISIIPVPLPDAPADLTLPAFLTRYTWVDLRSGITPDGINRLFWGITGEKPSMPSSRRIHNLPFLSMGNLLKGRDADLQSLAASLQSRHATAIVQPQAIHGLGGIGKTRLAVEYAWRSGDRHHAALFVRAESPEALHASLAGLAVPLSLSISSGQPQEEIIRAVFGWLQQNPGWLLILDNVDTEEAEQAVLEILPALKGGHILITSRRTNWPAEIQERPIEKLSQEEATRYLLDRTKQKRASGSDDTEKAGELASLLDGLPLALEQAAAYINHRRISFSKYLKDWQGKRKTVLDWYDASHMRYPAPVAVTWQSTFDQLCLTAKSILRLSAYLAPDPIPVEMFEEGEKILKEADARLCAQTGEEIESTTVDEALADLAAYSMASFSNGMFTVHRMVQEVLRTRVPKERRRDWIELSLRLVNDFSPPDPGNVRSWPVWDVLRPHVAEVVGQADQVRISDPTARLMNHLGQLLSAKGLYPEAEPLMRRALTIHQETLGEEHPNLAIHFNNLAQLLQDTNRLAEAEPLMHRALAIDQSAFGENHPKVAIRLNNLASLLQATNRLAEAEPLMRRALDIDQNAFGENHPDVATDLNNLASLLQATNRLSEAEPLMRRALDIDQNAFGENHPNVARDLNNLAQLLQATNRLSEAEPLMRQALEIWERSLGPDHPHTGIARRNLESLLKKIAEQGEPPESSPSGA